MLACLVLSTWSVLAPIDPSSALGQGCFQDSLYSGVSASDDAVKAQAAPSRFSVSLYFSDVELSELDAESVTFLEVPRERLGVQFGWGQAYFRIYEETVDAPVLGTEFEGYGFGLGVQGAYVTHSNVHASYLFDYDLSVDFGFLDEDVADAEVRNLSVEGKVGPGFAKDWFRASAGLAASFTYGTLEVPGFEDIDLDGQNLGFYASVGYLSSDIPVKARIDLHLGDIEGLAITLGYSF